MLCDQTVLFLLEILVSPAVDAFAPADHTL